MRIQGFKDSRIRVKGLENKHLNLEPHSPDFQRASQFRIAGPTRACGVFSPDEHGGYGPP
jgi:hypothetical protein